MIFMSGRKVAQFYLIWTSIIILLVSAFERASAQDRSGTPTVQDCLGAIPVCQSVYTTTASYTGHGNVYPEIHANSVCPLCMDGEKNDVFYIITVQTNGILRFKLTPNNITNDYDWSLFNMTSAGCDQIYTNATSLQVSCNSYGITGNNGPTGINSLLGNNFNCNGPGVANGPAFNKDLTVTAGQTYVLNISNWSSTNQSGYTLDFSASTASIFDNVPPLIDSIQQDISCAGTTSIYFRFSENVKCSDVFQHPEKFSLVGPAGAITISDVTGVDCATGAANGRGYNLILSTPVGSGSYTLNITGDIHDLCNNLALYQGYPFQLTEINAPVAAAGNDTSVANGTILTLHGNASSGTPPYAYHWEPANLLVNSNVQRPTTIGMGASALFTVTVTDNAGCHGMDEVLVTVVGGPLGVTTTASPQVICPGEAVTLMAVVSGGSGSYSFLWTSDPPGFTSTLQNPTVYPNSTTTYHVQVQDGFSTISGTTVANVNVKPVANPGGNSSIPYGTNAQLAGSASGGSGNYSWYWTSNPPGFSSTLQNPLAVNLTLTTIFTLTVTDLTTLCVSEPVNVTISVTGSPLSCNPVATPAVICKGNPSRLNAMVGGGAGTYTYSWSSDPPGFVSQEANPEVVPTETTNYLLTVSDGYNSTADAVNVRVNPIPVIRLGPPDSTACIYSTVILDAGNPGAQYYWSNGSTAKTLEAVSAGIGYDVQNYSVRVINEFACADSAEINVIFSFSACTGMDERLPEGRISIGPNPGEGTLNLTIRNFDGPVDITITTIPGAIIFHEEMRPDIPGPFSRSYDLSSFPKGLYLVNLRSKDFSRTLKFINR